MVSANAPRIELVIDEVVVVGGDPHDRHAIHDALAAHLEEQLATIDGASLRRTDLQVGSISTSFRRTDLQAGSIAPSTHAPDLRTGSAHALARAVAASIVSAVRDSPTPHADGASAPPSSVRGGER